MKLPFRLLAPTLAVCGLMALPASAQIAIDLVQVGNPGNASDSTGYGGVTYGYAIGKYEVTASQYATFLNAVAKTDTYGLYNQLMATDLNIASITRSGIAGSYTYSALNGGNQPITYVSWFDAARFVNWLQNGQPVGAQGPTTTEMGVYSLNGAMSGAGFTRAAGVTWGLPTESEWYKAAYYQPAGQGGDSDGYWLYPTGSNDIPNSRNGSVTDPNSANFFRDDGVANGYNGGYAVNNSLTAPSGLALMQAASFGLADSFYGTFDQGGSVWEWTDAVLGANRVIRGGAWGVSETTLRATSRNSFFPQNEDKSIGFRVDYIPEPGALGLMVLGIVMLLGNRKRGLR